MMCVVQHVCVCVCVWCNVHVCMCMWCNVCVCVCMWCNVCICLCYEYVVQRVCDADDARSVKYVIRAVQRQLIFEPPSS